MSAAMTMFAAVCYVVGVVSSLGIQPVPTAGDIQYPVIVDGLVVKIQVIQAHGIVDFGYVTSDDEGVEFSRPHMFDVETKGFEVGEELIRRDGDMIADIKGVTYRVIPMVDGCQDSGLGNRMFHIFMATDFRKE
jgi:hypothetical protein